MSWALKIQGYQCKVSGCYLFYEYTDARMAVIPKVIVIKFVYQSVKRRARYFNVLTRWLFCTGSMSLVKSFVQKPQEQRVDHEAGGKEALCWFKKKLWIWKAYDSYGDRLLEWKGGDHNEATLIKLVDRLTQINITFSLINGGEFYKLFQSKDEVHGVERNKCWQRHGFARSNRKSMVTSKSVYKINLSWLFLLPSMSIKFILNIILYYYHRFFYILWMTQPRATEFLKS